MTERNGASKDEIGTRDEVGKLVFPQGKSSYLGYNEKQKENRVNEAGPAVSVVSSNVEEFVESKKKEESKSKQLGKNGKQRNKRVQPKKK